MQATNYADLMPKYLGYPFYPAGFPIQATDFEYNGKNILECYCFPRDKEDRFLAAAWVDYFVQAPIWAIEPEHLQKILSAVSVTEKIQLCLEIGLDPF